VHELDFGRLHGIRAGKSNHRQHTPEEQRLEKEAISVDPQNTEFD
jgi:hypothetical protein